MVTIPILWPVYVTGCRYILPLSADTITPVQQGICQLSLAACVNNVKYKVIPSIQGHYANAKAKDLMHQGQGQGQGHTLLTLITLRTMDQYKAKAND